MFRSLSWQTGDVYSDADGRFPTIVSLLEETALKLPQNATHYGYVVSGDVSLQAASREFLLQPGMYFSVPSECSMIGRGRAIVASRLDYLGLFQLGGPIESTGRLRYIDGCSDTVLIGPPLLGDPCLNLLHIPARTHQTQHTHPSLRVGLIVSGSGRCVTPERTIELTTGLPFVIEAESQHSFHTDESDLLVIAYHPDSDTGPTHDDHPMVNRTIVDGVSARHIDAIRTTKTPMLDSVP